MPTFFHKRTPHGPSVVPIPETTVHALMVLDHGTAWFTSFTEDERASLIKENFEVIEWPYGYGIDPGPPKTSRKRKDSGEHKSDAKQPHLSIVREDD